MAQPFSTVKDPKHPNSSATQWTSLADLDNGTYYFASATSPFIVWADFSGFNPKMKTPMKLDMRSCVSRVAGLPFSGIRVRRDERRPRPRPPV